jgi:hypothetical protein
MDHNSLYFNFLTKYSFLGTSSGITVHTRENEEGETEVLGIDDDEDSQTEKETYETVTIVPSEGDSGEVSYVLIVQQPEDGKDEKDDMKVYDFDEAEGDAGQVRNFFSKT